MKKESKHRKRVKKLIGVCAMCAIIMTASTYAWFVGMKTVNISQFDIKIATTEGLFLSMDGKSWTYELDAKGAADYTGNTNTWAEDGLIPMSTVGDMDSQSSNMKLYEKGSLTTTKGGYRLLTSRVENNKLDNGKYLEKKGYVAFDLFIKNLSGAEYYTTNEPLNEEAIYLTTNSKVIVSSNGGEPGTGIENSVRVAFTQVGRVKADTPNANVGNITAITCSDVAASGTSQVQVTGICRNATIWEPNDTKHVQNALNWYTTSCLPRSGATASDNASYGSYGSVTSCAGVTTTSPQKTYAISRALGVDDNVDVYDGQQYNTYANNVKTYAEYSAADDKSSYKLIDFPYFTDTMKDKTGTSRPTFMTLAPNSITKLRVYVYIEGQDIDNYDFASLGKQISVNFGFTKERFTEQTMGGYDGPSTDITRTATE